MILPKACDLALVNRRGQSGVEKEFLGVAMKNLRGKYMRRHRTSVMALIGAALVPLTTGCALLSPPVIGFTAFNALYFSFVNFLPLRSIIGSGIREVVVSIF